MKKLLLICSVVLLFSACQTSQSSQLRHVVCFKFKDDATPAQIDALIEAFEGLQNDISQIKGFEWGLNNSPEPYTKGMTHIFTLTFENEQARDEYLPHPSHVAFGEQHGLIIEDAVVVDYTVK